MNEWNTQLGQQFQVVQGTNSTTSTRIQSTLPEIHQTETQETCCHNKNLKYFNIFIFNTLIL
jgi:hypothetical protein